MHRRRFLQFSGSALALAGGSLVARPSCASPAGVGSEFFSAPTFSITPVVGDGKWIWKTPPANQTGYLEPRSFEMSVGIELEGTSTATGVRATTAAPVKHPEQKIDDLKFETVGCEATIRPLASGAGQLLLAAPVIAPGQVIRAVANYSLTLSKDYQGFEMDQFPAKQKVPADVARVYLGDSPGIQARDKEVKKLAAKLAPADVHPWEKAQKFHAWVWENIETRVGVYTNVLVALRDRIGDCEERAAVFVAFCRAAGIPARLVWVPNHNWAEFWLHDAKGKGHWVPAHTSAYDWFGWTGAHELVLQKGDKISIPEERKPQRLLADWMQWIGGRPKVRYYAELRPVASEKDSDPGPGARSKDKKGQWLVTGKHPDDKYMRV